MNLFLEIFWITCQVQFWQYWVYKIPFISLGSAPDVVINSLSVRSHRMRCVAAYSGTSHRFRRNVSQYAAVHVHLNILLWDARHVRRRGHGNAPQRTAPHPVRTNYKTFTDRLPSPPDSGFQTWWYARYKFMYLTVSAENMLNQWSNFSV